MSQFRDLIAQMAIDPEFAQLVRANPDAVAARYGLTADETEKLRGLADAAAASGPQALGARLSKSGIGTGGLSSLFSGSAELAGDQTVSAQGDVASGSADPAGDTFAAMMSYAKAAQEELRDGVESVQEINEDKQDLRDGLDAGRGVSVPVTDTSTSATEAAGPGDLAEVRATTSGSPHGLVEEFGRVEAGSTVPHELNLPAGLASGIQTDASTPLSVHGAGDAPSPAIIVQGGIAPSGGDAAPQGIIVQGGLTAGMQMADASGVAEEPPPAIIVQGGIAPSGGDAAPQGIIVQGG